MPAANIILAILFTFAMFVAMANANSGDATWYHTGTGACGAPSKDTDHVVALSKGQYGTGSHCYKHISVQYQGKSVDATIVDLCEGCSEYSIDLSPSAFQTLAPLGAGRIQVTWNYE